MIERLYQAPLELVRELGLRLSARAGITWVRLDPGNWQFGIQLAHYTTTVICDRTPGRIRRARGVKLTIALGKRLAHWHRVPR